MASLAAATTALEEKEAVTLQAVKSQEETAARMTAFEGEINNLKSLLADKETALSQAQEGLTELQQTQQKLEENKGKVSSLEQQITELQNEIDGLKAERDQLQKKNADTDNDGVSDADDTCADTPAGAKVDSKGCPSDADQDGIVDGIDLCSETEAGTVVNSLGCVDGKAIILEGITFKTGTANLTEEARKALTATAAILKETAADQKFEVAGYTDSIGEPALNLQISKQRAKSVQSFLVEQGLKADLLIPKGYGQENPVADNATRKGRARNRRVELHKIADE